MGDSIKNFLIFSVGAAIGVAASWKFLKTKYETIAQEEIDSVKERFAKREKNLDRLEELKKVNEIERKSEPEVNKDVIDYSKLVTNLGYADEKTEEEGGDDNLKGPCVIPPDEFGDYYDYATVSLTYYADGVLEDENGNVLEEEDIEEMLVPDFADHFGEWEDDSVFIRNEKLQTDYEILADTRNYSDVLNNSSYGGAE